MVDEGHPRIVSAGGDGTLSLLARTVLDAGRADQVTLAVLPLGTGNDVARALGVLDLDDAIDAATGSSITRIDVLATSAGAAINNVHLGIGADAARRAGRWKSWLGPAAYAVGGILAGARFAAFRAEVQVDGEVVHDGATLAISMGNGSSVGGGLALTPDAEHDDGRIEVVVAADPGRLARAGLGLDLRRGTHLERPDVARTFGREVTVRSQPIDGNRDGELFGPVDEFTCTLSPAALRLAVPSARGMQRPGRSSMLAP